MLFAALAALVMLSSFIFVALEADHDCTGEHCLICHQISVCEKTLRQLTVAFVAAALLAALDHAARFFKVYRRQTAPPFCTLVSLKVKLSN